MFNFGPLHDIKLEFRQAETPPRQRTFAFARLSSQHKQSWYVQIVNRFPSKYGLSINTGNTIARHSRSVELYAFFASVRGVYQILLVWRSCQAALVKAHVRLDVACVFIEPEVTVCIRERQYWR